MAPHKKVLIAFVEGQTEKEFFSALFNYYLLNSIKRPNAWKIYNVKGVTRFEKKVAGKLKYEILPHFKGSELSVACCYDTDVFEFSQRPPTNWDLVMKSVTDQGIKEFCKIKATHMIEDWFLYDTAGLCKFLNIKFPQKLYGSNGLEKIKTLFKKGNKPKLYQKGTYVHKFIPFLDLKLIHKNIKLELKPLEKALGVKLS